MSSAVARTFRASELSPLAPREWRHAVEAALAAGARPLTMYGRAAPGGIMVTAVLERPPAGDTSPKDRDLTVLRTVLDPRTGYHAFTPDHAAMHCFERELHEQHDVRVAGHPWPKAIRFERSGWAGRDSYPFYEIKGKEVHEVAVGPVHAGVIEPGSFRFTCHGETVHHLEIHLGYQHRGVEELLLQRDPRALAPLVETIAGDTSVGHTSAYCAAVEALAGVEVAPEVDATRAVMLELERIAMHLSGLAGMSSDIGFLQGGATYGRLRTTAINTSMRLCGSRFGRGAIRPGGHGASLEDGPRGRGVAGALTVGELRESLDLLTRDLAIIDACFLGSLTVRHRLKDTGTLLPELAGSIGLVGLAARASGIRRDVRSLGGDVYREHPIEPATEPSGDCWARARVRVEELRRSLAWIGGVVDAYPSWRPSRSSVGALAPAALALGVVEGFRGELVHALETDEDGRLVHYKVQDPSLRNWLGVALAVRGNEISDFPICNKSFDLSYCGHDL